MADIQKICDALEKAKDIIEQWIPMFEQYNTPSAIDDAIELLKEQQWHDASIRPPREGRYIVWGLYTFVPDHNNQPNAYWQTRIANWFDSYGWDTKVKYWMELPNPPTE